MGQNSGVSPENRGGRGKTREFLPVNRGGRGKTREFLPVNRGKRGKTREFLPVNRGKRGKTREFPPDNRGGRGNLTEWITNFPPPHGGRGANERNDDEKTLSWLLMALMIVVGVCYPARRAMQVQPAEALHDE